MARIKVPNTPSIRRMPTYLHKLMQMRDEGEEFASTTAVAEYMNLDPIIVRKDFSLTGLTGMPGVGYKTKELIEAVRHYLGWDRERTACLVGAGSLGSALIGHGEFAEYGLRITLVFDSDPAKIGRVLHGREILDVRKMRGKVKAAKPDIAVLCVPSSCAQMVADELVKGGVVAFWNFANVSLRMPDGILVQREVIAGGFAVLSAKLLRGADGKTGDSMADCD